MTIDDDWRRRFFYNRNGNNYMRREESKDWWPFDEICFTQCNSLFVAADTFHCLDPESIKACETSLIIMRNRIVESFRPTQASLFSLRPASGS
jgi:hypothetical protein